MQDATTWYYVDLSLLPVGLVLACCETPAIELRPAIKLEHKKCPSNTCVMTGDGRYFWIAVTTGPCGRGHLALALLTIMKRDRYASESPLRKFATAFSQPKNHYGRRVWYQNDQKSVEFNVAVIVC